MTTETTQLLDASPSTPSPAGRSRLGRLALAGALALLAALGTACEARERCIRDTYTVTDPNAVGSDPTEVCNGRGECPNLRAALNTANLCVADGPKTVVLPAGGFYQIADPDTSPVYAERRDEAELGRIGDAVGLPHTFNDVTIQGNGSRIEVIDDISGVRHFHVSEGFTLTLQDLSLAGATGAVRGGSIYNDGSLVTQNVSFEYNAAKNSPSTPGFGGAIYNGLRGRTQVVDSSFVGGRASGGAAIYDDGRVDPNSGACIGGSGQTLAVSGSTFRDHLARNFDGNVIEVRECGDAVISESTIEDNLVVDGAIRSEGTLHIEASTVAFNEGISAGGLFVFAGETLIESSTFTGNEANGAAAVRCGSAPGTSLDLADVTIARNQSMQAFESVLKTSPSCQVAATNTVVGENAPRNCGLGSPAITVGVNADTDGSCDGFSDTLPEPMEIGSLSDNGGPTWTMLPSAGSPLVNRNSICGPFDQRGQGRPVVICDLGAVERQSGDPAENGDQYWDPQ